MTGFLVGDALPGSALFNEDVSNADAARAASPQEEIDMSVSIDHLASKRSRVLTFSQLPRPRLILPF